MLGILQRERGTHQRYDNHSRHWSQTAMEHAPGARETQRRSLPPSVKEKRALLALWPYTSSLQNKNNFLSKGILKVRIINILASWVSRRFNYLLYRAYLKHCSTNILKNCQLLFLNEKMHII